VEEFWKSVKIWHSYHREFGGPVFLEHSVDTKYNANYRMWANAERDGHPAEYRWHRLFNAAKFRWRPLIECRAVMLPRRETRWNLQGAPNW